MYFFQGRVSAGKPVMRRLGAGSGLPGVGLAQVPGCKAQISGCRAPAGPHRDSTNRLMRRTPSSILSSFMVKAILT